MIKVVKLQKEIGNVKIKSSFSEEDDQTQTSERNNSLYTLNEKLGDAFCNLGLYELGLNCYFEQVCFSFNLDLSKIN